MLLQCAPLFLFWDSRSRCCSESWDSCWDGSLPPSCPSASPPSRRARCPCASCARPVRRSPPRAPSSRASSASSGPCNALCIPVPCTRTVSGKGRRVNGKAFQYGCVDMGVPHRSSRELVEAQSFVFQKHIWKRSDSCGRCALIISWPTFRQRELILATGDCSFKSSDFGGGWCPPVIVFLLCAGSRWAQWAVGAYQQAENLQRHIPCRARSSPLALP